MSANEHNHSHCCDEVHGCCEGHDEHDGRGEKLEKILLIAGFVLLALSFIPFLGSFVRDALRIACAAICGYPTAVSAFGGIKRFRINEAFLMTLAVIAAIIIGEFFEAAAVAFLFRVGEALEDYAGERSKRSLEAVFSIVPDKGHIILEDGSFSEIDGDDIEIGMKLAVLPHEKVPVDGVIIHGAGTMDTSALTGEGIPVEVSEGSAIISGSINGNTTLLYEATAAKKESGAARIVSMVEEAAAKKGRIRHVTDRFASLYTPIVIALSFVYFVVCAIVLKDVPASLHRALVLVVASCPCAVILSVPLAFISSMGACAKKGIIIKGSDYIEALSKADITVLDKTGTLTSSVPSVGEIYPAPRVKKEDVLRLAAVCEKHSAHPLAQAVMNACDDVPDVQTQDYEELPGGGTAVNTPKGRICTGGAMLMQREGVDISFLPEASIYVSLSGRAVGCIEVVNEMRNSVKEAICVLKKLGMKDIIMLTGDTENNAAAVSEKAGITDYRSGLTPGGKLEEMEKIMSGTKKGTVYVGDGINDAPVLARASAGVAMGLGTEAACEAADVILADSQLFKLCEAVKQSKNTMNILKENIVFSLAVKLVVIILGLIGVAPLWLAVAADVGTMIICVLNSARLGIKKSMELTSEPQG